jgi:hypothetical protein
MFFTSKNNKFINLVLDNFNYLITEFNFEKILTPKFIYDVWKDPYCICYKKEDIYILIMKGSRERELSVIVLKTADEKVPSVTSIYFSHLGKIINLNSLPIDINSVQDYSKYELNEVIVNASSALRFIIANKIDIFCL